jgi:flagellar motor switch protein FliM
MNLFGMLEMSGSALGAERQRAEVVASNMANAQTTRTPAGGPYRRQMVVFQAQRIPRFSLALAGLHRETSSAVRVAAVLADTRSPVLRFEPGHPDADKQGYVAYLRIIFECSLVSAEHLTYREFLQRLPESTYLASCDLAPVGAVAVLQLDLAVAFPIIDLLLGGEGKGGDLGREITAIEEQVLESIMRIICRELQTTWQAIALEFHFGQRQPVSHAQRLMVPEEKNLCLSLEVKMEETRGTLNLAVPAVVSNALLRKISADLSCQRPRSPVEARHRLEKKLLDCSFQVDLAAPQLPLSLQSLADLTPDTLLTFPRSASAPAVLQVGKVRLCSAMPVRVNNRRGARVLSLEPTMAGES